MTAALGDAAARERVRTHIDSTLFVDAGAGTGKTTALVGRFLELVRNGVPVPAIAAITFTEAAATELRDRLRNALDDAEAAGEVAAGTVETLDEAAISTLHGFAQRLLAAAPLQAGVPPGFTVVDETHALQAFDHRWNQFCDEVENAPDTAALLERALAAGVTYRSLRAVAGELHQARHRLPDVAPASFARARAAALAPVEVGPAVAALRKAAAYAEAALDPADKLCLLLNGDVLPGFEELASELEAATTDADRVELLAAITAMPTSAPGNKRCWGEQIEDVRAARDAACATVDTAIAGVRERLVPALTSLLCGFVTSYAEERLHEGTLEFHDLLVAARDLLRRHDQVRHNLAARYQRLLIDEFQDTDPLQIELATLLTTTAADTHGRAWDELEAGPGRLFFVGDAKQSIYRFRNADLQLFERARAAHGAELVALDNNFRSVPGILTWVNEVFDELLDAQTVPGQAPPQPLVAARRELAGSGPAVRMLGGVFADMRAAERRAAAASDVAAVLHEAHRDGWPVGTGAPNAEGIEATRHARWADMAVLLPTRTSLPQLEAALVAHDVPYRVDSASLVWQSAPVRDVLLVLAVISDPNDTVALVGALRSPLLGCPDGALLEYHRAGGHWEGWRWRRPPPEQPLPPHHPVLVALAALRHLAEQQAGPVGGFVDLVLRRLGAFEVATANRRPRDHWRRVRFLVEEARAFDHSTGGTLAEFVVWAQLQGSDEARVREPVLPEDDDDAVPILTVHGAKGRQFPICVLSGLGQTPNTTKPNVLWEADGQPVVSFRKGIADAAYGPLSELEGAYADHERIRLLYVAATRARDHLVVCLHRAADDDAKAAERPQAASLAARLAHMLAARQPAGEAPPERYTTGPGDAELAEGAPAQKQDTTVAGGPVLAEQRQGAPEMRPAEQEQLPGMGGELHAIEAERPGAAWQGEETAWHEARHRLLTREARQPVVAATSLAARLARGLSPLATGSAVAAGDELGLLTDNPTVTATLPGGGSSNDALGNGGDEVATDAGLAQGRVGEAAHHEPATSLRPAQLAEAGDAAEAEQTVEAGETAEPEETADAGETAEAGEIADAGETAEAVEATEPAADAPAWRRGRAGTAIGRAVHATLQLADLANPASVEPLATAQAAAEGIDRLAGRVATLARAALGADVVRDAVAARHWREVYLAAPVGATLLEGFVDLLYETPAGLVVVDYKTDAVPDDAAIDAALPQYRLQLAAYALLVGLTTQRPVAGAALVFLAEEHARTRWISDLPDAVAEVRTALQADPGSGEQNPAISRILLPET